MPRTPGKAPSDNDYDAANFSALRGGPRPALVIVLELEERPRATVRTSEAADELRLLDDLASRKPKIERELLAVFAAALHQLDMRTLNLAPADLGRRAA
jgi:hypothetical protein